MSTLDDAYEAADESMLHRHPEGGNYIDLDPRKYVRVFLAYLADNPPDEMAGAAFRGFIHSTESSMYGAHTDGIVAALRSLIEKQEVRR